ncbi:hypothetical protein PR003_g5732 [Phytophthora rubi]|uniref:Transmembrane protein n=1 Tax=Phytophthora rubi TaxID=129364 RepID=A0A6A4FIP0_9STRA|nr:hypothetical protein PR002_g5683 [Phytophthora rubi]KAE9043996.1 hypothetical protein PR001_g5540 [Phytophthora rubi]KAE9349730.1 hypothetical protein PR003_g5732 [Phytophthora rubi]
MARCHICGVFVVVVFPANAFFFGITVVSPSSAFFFSFVVVSSASILLISISVVITLFLIFLVFPSRSCSHSSRNPPTPSVDCLILGDALPAVADMECIVETMDQGG